MHYTPLWRSILMILLIGISGCATGSTTLNPYFELPPDRLIKAEQELYNRALEKLKNNHPNESIDLWKRFLENSPRSFRGYNNLGMALYSNDQLEKSLTAFETALALEPFDLKIKDNLKRALRFQVTILRESKEYEKAIQHLERVKKVTDLPGKEKVALEIETLQDRIYEQVKRANTLEGYEAFLAKYPDNPKNSDEARRQIAKMKPQEAPVGTFPEMKDKMVSIPGQRPTQSRNETIVSESFVPEPMKPVPSSPPAHQETIEIVAETQQPGYADKNPAEMQEMEPVRDEAPPIAMQQPKAAEPITKPMPDPNMEMKREKPIMASKPVPTKRVRIMTRKTPLRVREKPDNNSKVVAQIPKNTVVLVLQESKGWFQVEYQKGKEGWITKKYSKLIP
jgi:Tfp pilus assembly protein PilF